MSDERMDFEYRTHETFQHLESNPAQVRSPYPDKRVSSLVSLCHSPGHSWSFKLSLGLVIRDLGEFGRCHTDTTDFAEKVYDRISRG